MDYRGLALIAAGRGAERVRLPAVGDLGLEQPGHRALHRRSAWRCSWSSTSSRCAPPSPLIAGEHLPDPAVPGREPRPGDRDARVHPGVLLRQRVRADLARQVALGGRPRTCSTSSSASWSRRRSAGGCSTGSAPSGRWCSAACSARSASGCGPARSPSLELRLTGVVHRPRRRRDGLHARPGEHRRRQPRLAALLRRGDRHHADRPQLRRQPRARDPRHDPRLADALARRPPR